MKTAIRNLSATIIVLLFSISSSYAGVITILDSIQTQYNANGSPIAWDGSTFWTKSGSTAQSMLHQYNLNGELLNSISDPSPNPIGLGATRALTSDGTSLWSWSSVNDQSYLYQFDFSGNILSIVPTEVPYPYAHGLTWDGSGFRAMVGSSVYRLDTNGNVIASITSSAFGQFGLAFDGISYITDHLGYDTIYRVDAENGNILDTTKVWTEKRYIIQLS